jgi:hypothetical protein
MPNHYHFLLRQETELSLWMFMQVLFNWLYRFWRENYRKLGEPFNSKEYVTFVGDVADEVRSYEKIRKYLFD